MASGRRRNSFGRSGTAPRRRRAFGFLADARCFLHYHYGRDDNQLSYDAQAQAAARGVGVKDRKLSARRIGCASISARPG